MLNSETPTLKEIQIRASQMGGRLWRNTIGRFQNRVGNWVAVGLCEGSGDLIGFMPLDLGSVVLPIFTSIEVKASTTRTTPQQINFHQMVLTMHGVSAIVRSVSEFEIAATEILNSLKAKLTTSKE